MHERRTEVGGGDSGGYTRNPGKKQKDERVLKALLPGPTEINSKIVTEGV